MCSGRRHGAGGRYAPYTWFSLMMMMSKSVCGGFFLWFNGSSAGQFPQYMCPVLNPNLFPVPSSAVRRSRLSETLGGVVVVVCELRIAWVVGSMRASYAENVVKACSVYLS